MMILLVVEIEFFPPLKYLLLLSGYILIDRTHSEDFIDPE